MSAPVCFRRLAEHGLPADTAQVVANYRLREWVQWGGHYWGAQSLGDLLAPIIQQHQARQEAEEQERLRSERRKLLDDRCRGLGRQGTASLAVGAAHSGGASI